MSRELSQANRPAILKTPFGGDVLAFRRLDANEGLSELFEYRIEALSAKENLDFDAALGQQCHLEINVVEYEGTVVVRKKKRYFSGILVEAQWLGMQEEFYLYRLTLRPWLWLLGQTANCKIFHNQTVDKIIEKVLRDGQLGELRLDIKSYPQLEYCVQYRETNLAFVSRLMEEYGICYYFEHEAGSHRLVLADQASSHKPIQGTETIPFLPLDTNNRREVEHLGHWMVERRFRTGKITFRDYNYEKPDADMQAEEQTSEAYQHSKLEVYDYPGRYLENGDGKTLAKVKLESEQASDRRRIASGDAATLYPGGLTTLQRHSADSENKQFLVVRATHSFVSLQSYRSGADAGGHDYSGQYEFQLADRPFKPPQLTDKPTIFGPQTARVVGEKGEEIDVDDQGRILVKFHWDRDDEHLYRVRVAQVWAGDSWGGSFIPRIDQEVIVEFLEGDIDRPLVVGTVYNGKHKMPFGTKASKNINGIKSDTTTGSNGYNQLTFDDTKKAEKVEFRAEKFLDTLVRDTETRNIGEDFSSEKGEASRNITLKKGDDNLKVETGNQVVDVSQEILIKAGQKITLKVGDSTIVMDNSSITLTSLNIKVEAKADLDMSGTTTQLKGHASLTITGGLVKIN
ncbi:type VI secretion system secreted protein VgrG [Bosea sp. BE125]|uniref:type VI secretion system Vgr family protein n=1 Tax=Bosea sp. BE125 TaxID=2817909 RepID=UPI002863730F|nr:type VI secretion system tip protein TssI/VgrG [Bosea sp. BE125]MDR6871067.1 type VI secretion system secreted protein VgrG [Bosea sp. BE125]